MKKLAGTKPLTQNINALAQAARRRKARSRAGSGAVTALGPSASFVLAEPAAGLETDELLIAVADAGSVALQRVRVPRATPSVEGPTSRLVEVARRIAEIELIAAEIARPTLTASGPPMLTDAEERLLREGGLDPGSLAPEETQPLHRATAEYARILHDSYTAEQAADVLGVNASRIRQRLTVTPRTLYGIKVGKGWRIPRFQFHGQGLVPGIARVLDRLAPDLHPVAVHRWLSTPNPDLLVDDAPTSPLDWLRIGNAPEAVAELAAGL
ncbi:MAG: hypothetical protein ACT4PL_12290 [Phycisphaerales bacterium]